MNNKTSWGDKTKTNFTSGKIKEIENELKLKTEELNILRSVSEIITSTLDLNLITENLYHIFNKFTGCDRCFICLFDKEKEELMCKYEFGEVTYNEVGKLYKEETSSIRECFNKGKTSIRINVFIKVRNCYGDKITIPLIVQNQLIGVIFLESGKSGRFKKISVRFIESLANYAAIAINNAELFYSTYCQKQEIESLYEQTAAANAQLNEFICEIKKTKKELKEKNEELIIFNEKIKTGYLQTVMALANSIEAKDPYTRGHCQRVMEIACELADFMGLSKRDMQSLKYSAILHDIGKIGISASILNKTDSLSEKERDEIKKHPLISYNILKDIEFLKEGLDIVLQHHERYDGKGYPNGLKGDEICLLAKILCIADAFDAMTSDRPYRKSMSVEQAINEIKRCSGTQFDPDISKEFLSLLNSFR
ncbi:MAG: HD domain-containing phosphohydrolase [Acetivibrionales bacterium]|jgi:putative nucleotidyltransferase with HDIG domain